MTFGENGRVDYTWSQRNNCITAALQSDGKILLGGYQASDNGWSSYRAYVARLNTDGSIDESFGDAGSMLFNMVDGMKGTTVGIKELEDGKILATVITSLPAGVALYQMNADGSFDTEFGDGGIAFTEDDRIVWQTDYGKALYLNDGSVVAVSKMIENGIVYPYVCKLTPSGALDNDFGTSGTLIVYDEIQDTFAGIHAILDADENIIVGSTSAETPKKYQAMKVSGTAGTLMTEFGDNGIVVSSNTDNFNTLHGLGIDPTNGEIYAVGSSSATGWQTSVWKINDAGEEVDQCDGDAMLIYPFQYMDGMRICHFSAEGNIKLVGVSDYIDASTSEDTNQDFNFFVPIFSTVGLNEIEQSELSVYPNPAINNLNIHVSSNLKIRSYQIRNQLGQVIHSGNQMHKSISVAHLTPGVYFVEMYTSKGVAVRKFIKQ